MKHIINALQGTVVIIVIFILGFTLLSLLLYLVKSSVVFLLVGMVFLGFLGASVVDSKINK